MLPHKFFVYTFDAFVFLLCITATNTIDTSDRCVEDQTMLKTNPKFNAKLPDGVWDGTCSDESISNVVNVCQSTINSDSPQSVKLGCRILTDDSFIPFGFYPAGRLLDQPLSEMNFPEDLSMDVFGKCQLLHLLNDACFYYVANVLPGSFTMTQYTTEEEYADSVVDDYKVGMSAEFAYTKKFNLTYGKVAWNHEFKADLTASMSIADIEVSQKKSSDKISIQRRIWENEISRLSVDGCFQNGNAYGKSYIDDEFLSYFQNLHGITKLQDILVDPSFIAIASKGAFVPTMFTFAAQIATSIETQFNSLTHNADELMNECYSITGTGILDQYSYTTPSESISFAQRIKNSSSSQSIQAEPKVTFTQVGHCDIPLMIKYPYDWSSILLSCAKQNSGNVDKLPHAASVPATGFRHVLDIVYSTGTEINPLIPEAMPIYYRYCSCEQSDVPRYFNCYYGNRTFISRNFVNSGLCLQSYWRVPFTPDWSFVPKKSYVNFEAQSPQSKYLMKFLADIGVLRMYRIENDLLEPLWAICANRCLPSFCENSNSCPELPTFGFTLNNAKKRIELTTTTSQSFESMAITSPSSVDFAETKILLSLSDSASVDVFSAYGLRPLGSVEFDPYEASLPVFSDVHSYIPLGRVDYAFRTTSPNLQYELYFDVGTGMLSLLHQNSTNPIWVARPHDYSIKDIEGYYFWSDYSRIESCVYGKDSEGNEKPPACLTVLTGDENTITCQQSGARLPALGNDGKVHAFGDSLESPPCGGFDLASQAILMSSVVPIGNVTQSFQVFSPQNEYKLSYDADDGTLMLNSFYEGIHSQVIENPVWSATPTDLEITQAQFRFSNDIFHAISTVEYGFDSYGNPKEATVTAMTQVQSSGRCDDTETRYLVLSDDGSLISYSYPNLTYCGNFQATEQVHTFRTDLPMGNVTHSFAVTSPSTVYKLNYQSIDGTLMMYYVDPSGYFPGPDQQAYDVLLWYATPQSGTISQDTGYYFSNDNLYSITTDMYGLDASGNPVTSSFLAIQEIQEYDSCGNSPNRRIFLLDDGTFKSFVNGVECGILAAASQVLGPKIPSESLLPIGTSFQSFVVTSPNGKYKMTYNASNGVLTRYYIDGIDAFEVTLFRQAPDISSMSTSPITFSFLNNGVQVKTIATGMEGGIEKENVVIGMTFSFDTGLCENTNAISDLLYYLDNDGKVRARSGINYCGSFVNNEDYSVFPGYSLIPAGKVTQSFVVVSPSRTYKLTYCAENGALMMFRIDSSGSSVYDTPLWDATPYDLSIDKSQSFFFSNNNIDTISTTVSGVSGSVYKESAFVAFTEVESSGLCDSSASRKIQLNDDGKLRTFYNTIYCSTLKLTPQTRKVPQTSLIPVGESASSFVVVSPNNMYKLTFAAEDGTLMMHNIKDSLPTWYATPRDYTLVGVQGTKFINSDLTRLDTCIYGTLSTGVSHTSCYLSMQQTYNTGWCDSSSPRRMQLRDDGSVMAYANGVYCGKLEAAPPVQRIQSSSLVPTGDFGESFFVTSPGKKYKLAFAVEDGTLIMYQIGKDGADIPIWFAIPRDKTIVNVQGRKFTNNDLTKLETCIYGTSSTGASKTSCYLSMQETNNTGWCDSSSPRRMQLHDDGSVVAYSNGVYCGKLEAAPPVQWVQSSSLIPIGDSEVSFVVISPRNKYKLTFAAEDGTLMMHQIGNDGSEIPIWYAIPRDNTIVNVQGRKFTNNNLNKLETCIYGGLATGLNRASCYLSMQETFTTGWCDNSSPRRMQLRDDGSLVAYSNGVYCGKLEAAPPVRGIPSSSLIPVGDSGISFVVTSPGNKYKLAFAVEDGTLMMYQINNDGPDIPIWYAIPRDKTILNVQGYKFANNDLTKMETCIYGTSPTGASRTSCYLSVQETYNTGWCDSLSPRRMQLRDDGSVVAYANGVYCGKLGAAPPVQWIQSSSLIPIGDSEASFVVTSPRNKYKLTFAVEDGTLTMYKIGSDGSEIPTWYATPRDYTLVDVHGTKFTNNNVNRLETCIFGSLGTGLNRTSCYLSMQETYTTGRCDSSSPRRMQLTDSGSVVSYLNAKYCGKMQAAPAVIKISTTMAPTTAPTTSPTSAPTETPTSAPTGTPTSTPTFSPTTWPTNSPTAAPTTTPTSLPTNIPTPTPTTMPTSTPTSTPTTAPTSLPTITPTTIPTSTPTATLTSVLTNSPTSTPTIKPTANPVIGQCNQRYDQCGGDGYYGTTCCEEGLICVASDPGYSQCDADPQRTCLLEHENCLNTPESCCSPMTCQGDTTYSFCSRY